MQPTEDMNYGLGVSAADPGGLFSALAEAAGRLAWQPAVLARSLGELALQQSAVGIDVARAALGAAGEPPVKPEPGDRRFTDRAWTENPFYRGMAESYLVGSRWAQRAVDRAGLSERKARKAQFALRLLIDAMAPSNAVPLHPAVLKEAIDTGGLSLVRGFANFAEDAMQNGGLPSQVDRSSFKVGETLASTPGRVVFKNDLFELIAYEPQTEQVFEVPLLYSPPWVNKYYILDLAPGRSFIEFAVQQGFTVFGMSYRNPDESMAGLQLDDYLRHGLLTALDRVRELTGSESASVIGLCLGGTLTAMAMGILAARGEAERISSASLVNTLVDFSDPGEVAVFVDEETVEQIERMTARRGYLKSTELASTFTWMRANDLVWNYVVPNWGMGKRPPAFDILAWNADGTNLPAAMHSQFLRTCYMENRLSTGKLEIDGTRVDLSPVETPLYVLSSERDHIAPWRTSYRTTQLFHGEREHVLAVSGHIAGIISPPSSEKARHRKGSILPADPDEWYRAAEVSRGSWWPHWSNWLAARAGQRVEPPSLPDGPPAPGEYVRA